MEKISKCSDKSRENFKYHLQTIDCKQGILLTKLSWICVCEKNVNMTWTWYEEHVHNIKNIANMVFGHYNLLANSWAFTSDWRHDHIIRYETNPLMYCLDISNFSIQHNRALNLLLLVTLNYLLSFQINYQNTTLFGLLTCHGEVMNK